MVEDKSSSQDTVQKSGHAVLGNVSYDRDVVEIKLADAIDSDNYVGNFVKDVCVDDGALLHRTASEEKPVDRRSSLDLSCQMIGADSDISYYGKEDHSRTSAHELKPEAVALAPLCNIGADSGREYDLEDRTGTGSIAGSPGEKKISLQELLLLESAEESRNTGAVNSESSEKHKCPLNEEEAAQTSKDGDPDAETVLANTFEHISDGISSKEKGSGCPATMARDQVDTATALDVREPQKLDRYNPSVDRRSREYTSVPECSIPGITDAASSTGSICSFHNATSSTATAGLGEGETLEPGADTLSAGSSDIGSSEKSHDNHSGSMFSKAIAGAYGNGKKQEKHGQMDEEHGIGTADDAAASTSSASTLAQDGSAPAVQETVPGSSSSSSRPAARAGDDPDLSGPSIMSGPVSMSGHIAYSGNVSLRSDSSTTSTQSFAFPVLQREWTSSPVRMAKAERRRSGGRHRVWRKGIICCKF